MAVLFMDGFSHYATADLELKWTTNASGIITAGAGRFGTGALQFSGGVASTVKSALSSQATYIIGFAFKVSALGAVLGNLVETNATGTPNVTINSSGTLNVRRGATVLLTSTNAISAGVWYHLEWLITVNATTGVTQLKINGVDWIANTGSLNTGSSNSTGIAVRQQVTTTTTSFSDLFVLDDTGGAPWNTFLGDCKVETLRPTTEGNTIQWTPSTGTDNAALVDETTPNGDTDYNSDSTAGNKDTYVFGNLDTTGGSVFAVQTVIVARKDDAGVRQIAPVIRQSTTDYDGTTVTLSSTYDQYRQIYPQDPTATNWTIANVNADEFGVKTIA